MEIYERIFVELEQSGMKQKDLSEKTGISVKTISSWKTRGSDPQAKDISALADGLNISVNYLLTGEETSDLVPALRSYRTDHTETTETDKQYNKVIRLLQRLIGEKKADMLLSALQVPSERTCAFTDLQLGWLAAHLNTDKMFFEHTDADSTDDPEKLRELADGMNFWGEWTSEKFVSMHEEAKEWEARYLSLYTSVMQDRIDCTCFETIIDIFSRFKKSEQKELVTCLGEALVNMKQRKSAVQEALNPSDDDNKRKQA